MARSIGGAIGGARGDRHGEPRRVAQEPAAVNLAHARVGADQATARSRFAVESALRDRTQVGHWHDRLARAEREALDDADREAHAGEAAGPAPDGESVEICKAQLRRGQQRFDHGQDLLGVTAATFPQARWVAGAVVFYLFVYMAASMAVFGVLTYLSKSDDAGLETDEFVDLGKRSPLLGAVLAVGLGSLAGIPPLAGFIGKLLLFIGAFQAGLYALLAVAILGVILSIYYYFGWIKMALFEFTRVVPREPGAPELEVRPLPLGGRVALSVLALATLVLGFFQGQLSQWLQLG